MQVTCEKEAMKQEARWRVYAGPQIGSAKSQTKVFSNKAERKPTEQKIA